MSTLTNIIKAYHVPKNIDQLFDDIESNEHETYYIVDYSDWLEFDTIEALVHFTEIVDIPEEDIIDRCGTTATIIHDKYDYKIVIEAYEILDNYSHRFICSRLQEEE